MNKRIIALAVILLTLLIATVATSCNKQTPYSLWNGAVKDIEKSASLQGDVTISFGKNEIVLKTKSNKDGNEKSLEMQIGEDTLKVISDGKKNYYENEKIRFSSEFSSDNIAMRKLLEYKLPDAETLAFEKDFFSKAEFEKTKEKITFTVPIDGTLAKKTFAKDEDILFSEATLSAEFTPDGNLTSATLSVKATGSEFYGIPFAVDKRKSMTEMTDLTVKFENISYSSEKIDIMPESKKDYEELPALSQMAVAAFLASLRNESTTDFTFDVSLKMLGLSIGIPVKGKNVSAYDGENLTTRTTMTLKSSIIPGIGDGLNYDVFTDGKSDYVYFTSDDPNECYKSKPDANENNEIIDSDSILENFNNVDKLFEILKDARLSKQGENTIISVKLDSSMVDRFLSSDTFSQIGELKNPKAEIEEIVISSKGTLKSIIMSFSGDVKADLGDDNPLASLGASFNMTAKFTLELSDILDIIEPDIPKGYENYQEVDSGNLLPDLGF